MSQLLEMRKMADMQTRALILMGLLPLCSAVGAGEVVNHEATLQKICTADAAKAQAFKDAHPLLKFLYEQQCASFNSKAESEQDAHQASAKTNQPLKTEEVPSSKPQDELVRVSSESADSFYRLHPKVKLRNSQWLERYEAPVEPLGIRYSVASLGDNAASEHSEQNEVEWWGGMFAYALYQRSTGTSVTLNPDGSYWTAALLPGAVLPVGLHGNFGGLGIGYNWIVDGFTVGLTAEATTGELRMAQPYPDHRVNGLRAVHARLGVPVKRAHVYLSIGTGVYDSHHQTQTIRPNTASTTIGGLGLEYKLSEKIFVGIEMNRFLGKRQPLFLVSGQPASGLLHVHEYSSARVSLGYKFNP
jgi:opacity protein-like surface antigen